MLPVSCNTEVKGARPARAENRPGLDYRRLDFTDQSQCVRINLYDETNWQCK